MNRPNFDAYMNEQFKKSCPDAAKFLKSLNPIAKKHAEEDRFFFTVGMINHLNFSEDEQIEWDLAYASDVCPGCPDYDPDDPCEDDPISCKTFESLDTHEERSTP